MKTGLSLPMPRSALTVAVATVIALAAVRYAHDVLKLGLGAPTIDIASYYVFTSALRSGVDPFDGAELTRVAAVLQIQVAGTPPTFTSAGYLLFLPLTLLPYPWARLVWLVVSQAALAAAGVLWYRHLRPPAVPALLGLFVVLSYQPILEDIALGNLNQLVLLLVSLACLAHVRGHPVAAALALSWAVNLKPPYVLLIPFLFWIGSRGTAALALAFAAAWAALGLAVFGTYWLAGYARFLTVGSGPLHGWSKNLSPHALLHRLLRIDGPHLLVEALAIALALAIIGGVMRATRGAAGNREVRLAAWATAVASLPLVSPLTEEVHLVVLLIPLLVVLFRIEQLPGPRDAVLVIVATLLLASRYSVESFPAFAGGPASLASGGKALGAAALALVAARLAGRGAGFTPPSIQVETPRATRGAPSGVP